MTIDFTMTCPSLFSFKHAEMFDIRKEILETQGKAKRFSYAFQYIKNIFRYLKLNRPSLRSLLIAFFDKVLHSVVYRVLDHCN